MNVDLALLILRVVVGLIIAGHGAQKLFGWFDGPGMEGFTGWVSSVGLRPAGFWGIVAGLSEFGGGLLMALGWLTPFGQLAIIGAMLMAIIKVHWENGLWSTNGGFELPLTNLVVAFCVALAGPGRYSLDAALGMDLLTPLTLWGGLAVVVLGVLVALATQESQHAPREAEQH